MKIHQNIFINQFIGVVLLPKDHSRQESICVTEPIKRFTCVLLKSTTSLPVSELLPTMRFLAKGNIYIQSEWDEAKLDMIKAIQEN